MHPCHSRSDPALGMKGQMDKLSDHVIICGYGPVGRNLHENLHGEDAAGQAEVLLYFPWRETPEALLPDLETLDP